MSAVERAMSLIYVSAVELDDMSPSARHLRDDFTSITGHYIACQTLSKMVMCLVSWDDVTEASLVRELRIKHGYEEADILLSIQAIAYRSDVVRNPIDKLDFIISRLKSDAEYEIHRALDG